MLNLIKTRRSIRQYTDKPILRETILRLLESANWAPSAHNSQPWRFVILTDMTDKSNLANAMGQRLRADRLAEGDDPTEIERHVARRYAQFTQPPVLIVLCLSLELNPVNLSILVENRKSKIEWVMGVQSVAMAAQNLMIQAHADGLATCFYCAPLFAPDEVKAVLELPADWQPQGLIALGEGAQTVTKTRHSLETKVKFL